ncbi:MAG: helix-turn-helix transcriptional regulator [Eubacteriales bacterium]|nr:helix-turn-helix transcriptional regulator [Eubacteriales bacterium]
MRIGDKIKAARKRERFTQEKLAGLAGISRVTLGFYERNENMPPADVLGRIAAALGVSLSELVSSDELFDMEMYNDLQQEAAERYLEEIIKTLGYQFGLDSRAGTTWLEDSNGNHYEIPQDRLDRFTNSIMDYLKFQLQELIKSATETPTNTETSSPDTSSGQ